LVIPFISLSQKHYTRNLNIQDGLPSNKIRDIFKDSRGYIWIGTSAGLTKYDGNKFKTYTEQDGLTGNRVWSITEDNKGNLWLGCYGEGISKFNGRTFQNYNEDSGLVNNNVRKIRYSKKHGGLLIGTVCGFSYLKDGKFTNFKDPRYKELLQVTSFLETDSLIYLLTYRHNDRFIKFNPAKDTFQYLPSDHRFHYKSTNTTCSFISSNEDTLLGYYVKGMKIYRDDSVFLDRKVGQVFDIAEDGNGNLWFASWNSGNLQEKDDRGGVYRWSSDTSLYYNDELGIKTELGWCLFYDEEENVLWIGTLDKGIYLYPINGITYETAEKYNRNKPTFQDIFFDSRDYLWLTVGDKIILKTNKNDYSYHKEPLEQMYKSKHKFYNDPNGSYEKYEKLIEKGKYEYENPYSYYDSVIPDGKRYLPDKHDFYYKKPTINSFYKINEDRQGNVWVNSSAGYYYFTKDLEPKPNGYENVPNNFFFNKKNEKCRLNFNDINIYHYNSQKDIPKGKIRKKIRLRENTTYSDYPAYEREGDNFWIITKTDGLLKYRYDTLYRYSYLKDTIKTNYSCIAIDSLDNKIVGTTSGEVYILEEENDSIVVEHSILQRDGVIGTVFNWMVIDKNNNLWAGTNKGLNVIDLNDLYQNDELNVRVFTREDGYFDYTSKKAIFNPSKDTLYVISDAFLTKIPANLPLIYNQNAKPEIFIDNILVNYKEFDWSGLGYINEWTDLPENKPQLKHESENLIFNFGIKYYKNSENVRYSYKLEGLQKEWSGYTTENKAVFTSLSPGNYTFKVKGYLLSNPEKTYKASFSFEILPPWWQTVWFYILSGLLFVVLAYIIIHKRIQKLQAKAKTESRINQLKMDALQAQMNPHFIFNGFNALQKYILEQKVEPALKYLTDFSGIIRKTLDNSRKKYISIEEEVNYLSNYVELEKRKLENFTYDIQVDKGIDKMNTFIPPMLIQPLIENALYHGIRHLNDREGRVVVKFEKNGDQYIKCTVDDNGIGIKYAKQINQQQNNTYKSKGTSITEERLSLLNNFEGLNLRYIDKEELNGGIGTIAELFIALK
jgi:ligand-binding sensor domain-containing protein